MISDNATPFRWRLDKPEQLGRLTKDFDGHIHEDSFTDAREVSADIIAVRNWSHYVFVGRSLELCHDYLSGLFEGMHDTPDVTLFQFSKPGYVPGQIIDRWKDIRQKNPAAYDTMRGYMSSLGLDPKSLLSRRGGTCFADVVAEGTTFETIAALLMTWAEEEGIQTRDLVKKIGFLAVTWEKQTSPKTERWWQDGLWVKAPYKSIWVHSISIPYSAFHNFADNRFKTIPSHREKRWDKPIPVEWMRQDHHRQALSTARATVERAGTRAEKRAFAARLAQGDGMKRPHVRRLNSQLKHGK